MLPGAPGIAARSNHATGSSWPYYQEQEAIRNKKLLGVLGSLLGAKDATGSSWICY